MPPLAPQRTARSEYRRTPDYIDLEGVTAEELLAAFTHGSEPKHSLSTCSQSPSRMSTMSTPQRAKSGFSVADMSVIEGKPITPSVTASTRQDQHSSDAHDRGGDAKSKEAVFTAGYNLRKPQQLLLSKKAEENARPEAKRPRRNCTTKAPPKVTSDAPAAKRVGCEIELDSKNFHSIAERSRFLICHKEQFLPLLPEENYIAKLFARKSSDPGKNEEQALPKYEQIQQPRGIKVQMKPYQLRGLSFLVHLYRNAMPAILGDEMGLGKTGQAIALIQWLKENNRTTPSPEPSLSLVICPLSVLNSWISEIRRWAPGLKALRFHGPTDERNRLKRVALGFKDTAEAKANKLGSLRGCSDHDTIEVSAGWTKHERVDLIITTYETYVSEVSWFRYSVKLNYVIIDEGHRIKNAQSNVAKALRSVKASHRLVLTGTPVQNDMTELWALLHWLLPEVFTDATLKNFKSSFDIAKGKVDPTFLGHVRRMLQLVMLRRMKNSPGVGLKLPPKTDVLLFVPLTPLQRSWYMRLLTGVDERLFDDIFLDVAGKEHAINEQGSRDTKETVDCNELSRHEDGRNDLAEHRQKEKNTTSWRRLMNLVMQLRKVCNHPYMMPDAEPSESLEPGQHTILASGKFILLQRLIQRLVIEDKRKVLIFSCFMEMLDQTEDLLCLCGGEGKQFEFLRLDGQTCRARRNLAIRMFNDNKSTYRVMLVSTKAGGLGINLTSASDVVMLDHDWNPQTMLQAEARSHRIGQTNPVTVYKLCTHGTVEEQMLSRIQKKLYLSINVTESFQETQPSGLDSTAEQPEKETDNSFQLGSQELMSLVRRGAGALTHKEIDPKEMSEWSWETMLENCRDKPREEEALATSSDQIREQSESQWLAQMERVQTRVLEGKRIAKQSKPQDLSQALPEIKREDRRVGKHTTVMVDGFPVSKQSIQCGEWEAVPTLAEKVSKIAEPKRAMRTIPAHQKHCQACFEPNHLIDCVGCPRAYHLDCLQPDIQSRVVSGYQLRCPQHRCAECEQRTSDAGGMLYRCCSCANSFCEDCLDWDNTELLGDTLEELDLLSFGVTDQAFYIKCSRCCGKSAKGLEVQESFGKSNAEINEYPTIVLESDEADCQILETPPPLAKTSNRNISKLMTTPSLAKNGNRDVSALMTPPETPKVSARFSLKRKATDEIIVLD